MTHGDPQEQTMIQSNANTLKVPLQQNKPYLAIIYPREKRGSWQITTKGLILGRSSECDVPINDTWISRKHARISLVNGQIIFEDLGSTNGCFVNDQKIDRCVLNVNSRIQLGPMVLKVSFMDESEAQYDQKLFVDATTDPLTKIHNRRWFYERAQTELHAAKRGTGAVHMILLDIDFFKKVNDTYGHQAGDFILQEVALLLKQAKREEDLLARYGGEEFIVFFKNIPKEEAWAVAERMRKTVESASFVFSGQSIPIRISLGLFCTEGDQNHSLDDLISQADKALYQAKENGRNQVVVRETAQ
jgi:two-component system, cell cycle response regulator